MWPYLNEILVCADNSIYFMYNNSYILFNVLCETNSAVYEVHQLLKVRLGRSDCSNFKTMKFKGFTLLNNI